MFNQKGQILLITIMLLATVLTVVLAVTFKSTTETQITKLEEESQKALSAAEAGIEASLASGNIVDFSTLNVPSGFTGSASVSTTPSRTFLSPVIRKDQQFTIYLATPQETAPGVYDFLSLTPGYSGNLTLCFGNQPESDPALELTLIKQGDLIQRYVINPESDPSLISGIGTLTGVSPGGNCPSEVAFSNQFTLDTGVDNLLLLIRVLSSSPTQTRVGLYADGGNLPLQGRTITSEAKSPTGVSKKVQLFQSFPQIPAEFFVTSF